MATTETEQKPEEPVETTGSLLDMSQAAVKKMIADARERCGIERSPEEHRALGRGEVGVGLPMAGDGDLGPVGGGEPGLDETPREVAVGGVGAPPAGQVDGRCGR